MWCPNPDCPDREVNGRPGEFVDTLVRCPFCGVELVAALAPEAPESLPDGGGDGLEVALEVSDPAEVEVVRSILAGAEIPHVVQGQERIGALRGGHASLRLSPRAGTVVFLVPADRAEEARALLTPVDLGPDDDHGD